MKTITLIDGNSLLFRAFYATAGHNLMTSHNGIPTNAVYGFANMIDQLLEDHPDYIAVAFDTGEKTFRHELFQDYKGQRKKTPDELVGQFDLAREYLKCRRIPYLEMTGYEGDDIIGTISKIAEDMGMEVAVISGDQDMLQLVSDRTTVYRTLKGVSTLEANTPAVIQEKYGLVPDQIRDLKGLMGDPSDNIPGIYGVGEKTALKLLHDYHTVENLAAHTGELKGKLKEKVEAGIQAGLDSKMIATIRRDVPLEITMDDLVRKDDDLSSLSDFYTRYDMFSLKRKLPAAASLETGVHIVKSMPRIFGPVALNVGVFDHNYHKSIIIGFGVAFRDEKYYISFEDAKNDPAFLDALKDENIPKYGFNVKKSLLAARWHGIIINGFNFDLQLAAYVLEPVYKDELKMAVDGLMENDLDYEERVFGKGSKRHIPEADVCANYYGEGAALILKARPLALEKLLKENQIHLYEDIELPLTFILAEMEYTGVKVDRETLDELQVELDGRIARVAAEIYELAGEEFNIASPKQLGEILFEKLKLPYGKKTKTGYSTAADVLEKLKGFHPIIQKILDYRVLTKLQSTYIIGLKEAIFPDGRIHTMYNQALTATGRLSSEDPNLQNIPIRYAEGKKIRHAFVPAYDWILSFDYSQIELRVVASLAHVDALIDAFNHDIDIHTKTAADIFHVEMKDVTKEMRRRAKAINFGIIYGMSDYGLSAQVGVSVAEANDFIARYYESYPEIRAYMDEQIDFCEKHGYVETMMKRRRYIPEINDPQFVRRNLGRRLAMNTPIQGSAADLLKVAMIKVDKLMKQHHVKSKMILQVHDELVFDVPDEEMETMKEIVREGMEEAYPMAVSLKAEASYGKTWFELK